MEEKGSMPRLQERNSFLLSKLKMYKAGSQVTGAWVICLPEKQKYTYWGNTCDGNTDNSTLLLTAVILNGVEIVAI